MSFFFPSHLKLFFASSNQNMANVYQETLGTAQLREAVKCPASIDQVTREKPLAVSWKFMAWNS